jgi:hypothetical protein
VTAADVKFNLSRRAQNSGAPELVDELIVSL